MDVKEPDAPNFEPKGVRDYPRNRRCLPDPDRHRVRASALSPLPRGFSVSDQMSYGLVFLIGLVASVSSCLAVTGGLLVALAAKYNEANPYLTDRQRLIPAALFQRGPDRVLHGARRRLSAPSALP